jgi:transposase
VTTPTIIGLDIAKSSFQIHGVAACGRTTLRKKLRRGKMLEFFANLPPCLIGIEACGGAHYWARVDQARPRGAAHDAAIREAVCEDQQA